MEGADPAPETVDADGVILAIVLPELDFDVLDLVPGDAIGQVVELLEGIKEEILVVMDIDEAIDDGSR